MGAKVFAGFLKITGLLFAVGSLVACKTTGSAGLQDYSNGINMSVAAHAANPAYTIIDTVGAAGSGYAYLMEKSGGKWRVSYDSFDAKAFAKQVGNDKEVPGGSEVLWTDGERVAVYFSTEPLSFSTLDGSFSCPNNKDEHSHRACRSRLTEAKGLFDGLGSASKSRPFVLDFDEIRQAVADTAIVAIAKRRLVKEK